MDQTGLTIFAAVAFVVALATFTWCSFYISRVSKRIRRALEQRHPGILAIVAPNASADWRAHFIWQSDFNAVWATLPLLASVDDAEIQRDVVRLKRGVVIGVPSLVILFCAVVFLNEALRA